MRVGSVCLAIRKAASSRPLLPPLIESVAFVVMIAGPCIRGHKLFVLQSVMSAKGYGAPADYIAKRKVFDQDDVQVPAKENLDAARAALKNNPKAQPSNCPA